MPSCSRQRGCCEGYRLSVIGYRLGDVVRSARANRQPTTDNRQRAAGGCAMIVNKFGGTSVGAAQRETNAIAIVADKPHLRPIVVVCTLASVTNDLVAASEA